MSTEGQNLRLDLSNKFQDAIKVLVVFHFLLSSRADLFLCVLWLWITKSAGTVFLDIFMSYIQCGRPAYLLKHEKVID